MSASDISDKEIRDNLKRLSDDELVFRVSTSMLTDEAHKIALEILEARGIDASTMPSAPEQVLAVKSYTSETELEKSISRRTFVNLIIVWLGPIVPGGIAVLLSDLLSKYNSIFRISGTFLIILIQAVLIYLIYRQLFSKEDKLTYYSKGYCVAGSIVLSLFAIAAHIYGLFV